MNDATNIKKKKTGNIYWGIKALSGAYVHISEVESGQACQCNCAACGQPLEARKGTRRKHHFAHRSNYECLYAYEVSVFKAVEKILTEKKQLFIPDAVLKFNSYKESEIIKSGVMLDIDNAEFQCEPLQYPPELTVAQSDSRIRIVLEFGRYYEKPDEKALIEWAKEHNIACLVINLPLADKNVDINGVMLEDLLLTNNEQKKWIYNRKVEDARRRFEEKVCSPEPYGGGYICYAHKYYYRGRYSARWTDCVECEYCYEIQPFCKCLAKSGIIHYSDLFVSEQIRMEQMRTIISHNEQSIKDENERERARYEADKRRREEERALADIRRQLSANSVRIAARRRTNINPANYELGYNEIIDKFDSDGPAPTYDSYGNRWCICTECGTVKHTGVLSTYGFGGPNKGLCQDCVRKNNKH